MKRYRGVWLRMGALALCCVMALTATSCMALTKEYREDAEGKIPEVTIPTLDDYIGEDVLTTAPTTTTTTAPTADEPLTTGSSFTAKTMYVVAGGGLRMREQPNTDAKIILTIPTKSKVLVLKEEGDWSYVRYNKKEGWCASAWIFRSIEEATTTAKPKDDATIIKEGKKAYNDFVRSYRGKSIKGALSKAEPSKEEILALFEKAEKAYDSGPLSSSFEFSGDGPVYSDGYTDWMPGTAAGYDGIEDLCETYFSCLSDSIAYDCLKDQLAYIDGQLYSNGLGIGADWVRVEINHKVEKDGDRYLVTTTIIYHNQEAYGGEDEIETHVSICEKEDGNWIFTKIVAIPYN